MPHFSHQCWYIVRGMWGILGGCGDYDRLTPTPTYTYTLVLCSYFNEFLPFYINSGGDFKVKVEGGGTTKIVVVDDDDDGSILSDTRSV